MKGGKGGNPKVIHVSLSLHEDVKLRTAENAWKPTRLNAEGETTEDEKQTQVSNFIKRIIKLNRICVEF